MKKDPKPRRPVKGLAVTKFPNALSQIQLLFQTAHCKQFTSQEDIYKLHCYASLSPRNSFILDVGVLFGYSAIAQGIGLSAGRLVTVDLWEKNTVAILPGKETYDEYRQNLKRFRLRCSPVKLLEFRGNSHDPRFISRVVGRLRRMKYGFCFIDADHSYDGCWQDTEAFVKPLVPLDGYVGFHDYYGISSVTAAVNRLLDEGDFKLADTGSNLAILKRVKK